MIFLELFYTFFKIGLFGFGGGYGMLSLIQGEVVTQNGWLSIGEFTDIVAVSQMTPGPIGINAATYVGYVAVENAGYSTFLSVMGSLLASFAVMLPSFILMLLISHYLMKYSKHPRVEAVFDLLRPAVVGLIASAALLLLNEANFGSATTSPMQFWVSVAIALAAFAGMMWGKMNPILLILLCGLFGGVFYSL